MSPNDFLPPAMPVSLPEPMAPVAWMSPAQHVAPTEPVAAGSFGQLVVQGLERVNDSLLGSQVDVQRMASGDVGNLHQVMLKLEESRLSFQLMMQVRNRLLESYQDVMRMQV